MKSITFSSANLQNTVDCLNLFTITLNSGHFSLASAVVKALLGLHHFPYKSVATEHPHTQHGECLQVTMWTFTATYLRRITAKLSGKSKLSVSHHYYYCTFHLSLPQSTHLPHVLCKQFLLGRGGNYTKYHCEESSSSYSCQP